MFELHVNKVRSVAQVPLDGQTRLTLGRSTSNGVVLSHPEVSREHCVIEVDAGKATLRDLGSRHGTRINGQPLSGAVILAPGDVVGVGPFDVTFVDPSKAVAAPESAGEESVDDSRRQTIHAIDAESAARIEILQVQIKTMRRELKVALARGEQEARRVSEARETLDQRDAALEQARSECSGLQAAHEQTCAELDAARQRAEISERDLVARSRRLEEATALAASLKDRLERLEATHEMAARDLEAIQSVLAGSEASIQNLHETSLGLALVHRGVRALEALWLETSEWVEESQHSDPEVLEHALQQRDSIGEKLEGAHAERDAAVAELQASIERLRAVVAAPPSAPQTEVMPARASWLARRLRGAKSA